MRINVFRWCAGPKGLGRVMIVLVVAVIGVSYCAVVVLTWGPRLLHAALSLRFFLALALALLLLFHLLLILLEWSYFMVVFTDPGRVPPTYWTDIEDPSSASLGHCAICQNRTPPRCHHCSVCQRCVLKMDHHCFWVANCIGARNYKFFLLFLLYSFLETTLVTSLLLSSLILYFSQAKSHHTSAARLAIIFLASVLNLASSLFLLCLLIAHSILLSSNTTLMEQDYAQEKGVRWKYDMGRKKNFEQVFGTKKATWLFPLYSADDIKNIPALEFPTSSDA